ncbi:MAG: hypothetical protein Cons2KO_11170 [Congregibacter sp.]
MPADQPEAAPVVTGSGASGLFTHPGLLLAGSAAFGMSTLFSAMKPILLTRLLEETSWSAALAGLVVAMPFIGIALSSLLYYFRPPKNTVRELALRFGVLLVAAELVSAVCVGAALPLLAAQFVAGFSVGALMAATSRLVAVSEAADASFGFIDMMAVALMSVMVASIGMAVAAGGARGGYLLAAGIGALYALVMFCYREAAVLRRHHQGAMGLPALRGRPIAVIAMGMVFVTCSGLGFAFMFSLAADLGMGYEAAGSRIGVLLLLSALACQAGGWASGRFGPRLPLLAAFVCCAFGWWLAVNASTTGAFFLGLIPAVFALQFNFPILLALAGSLDEHGRWAGIAAPLITSGFAWAAVVAGAVVGVWGISALPLATMTGMAVCTFLLWPATAKS